MHKQKKNINYVYMYLFMYNKILCDHQLPSSQFFVCPYGIY